MCSVSMPLCSDKFNIAVEHLVHFLVPGSLLKRSQSLFNFFLLFLEYVSVLRAVNCCCVKDLVFFSF